jgi:hypothetical protein
MPVDWLVADEDRVGAAAVAPEELGSPVGDGPPQGEEGVARGEGGATGGGGLVGQPRRPPGRNLLEEGDVPVPAGDRRGELRGQGAAGRGRVRATVVEVPGQDAQEATTAGSSTMVETVACRFRRFPFVFQATVPARRRKP